MGWLDPLEGLGHTGVPGAPNSWFLTGALQVHPPAVSSRHPAQPLNFLLGFKEKTKPTLKCLCQNISNLCFVVLYYFLSE